MEAVEALHFSVVLRYLLLTQHMDNPVRKGESQAAREAAVALAATACARLTESDVLAVLPGVPLTPAQVRELWPD
jgi:hypothetical protein